MNKDIILEVLSKLIGPIDPVADAAIDRKRLENLKLFIDVFDEMHTMIDDIPRKWKNNRYGSVQPFINACNKQLTNMGIEE